MPLLTHRCDYTALHCTALHCTALRHLSVSVSVCVCVCLCRSYCLTHSPTHSPSHPLTHSQEKYMGLEEITRDMHVKMAAQEKLISKLKHRILEVRP